MPYWRTRSRRLVRDRIAQPTPEDQRWLVTCERRPVPGDPLSHLVYAEGSGMKEHVYLWPPHERPDSEHGHQRPQSRSRQTRTRLP